MSMARGQNDGDRGGEFFRDAMLAEAQRAGAPVPRGAVAEAATRDLDFLRLAAAPFAQAPKKSMHSDGERMIQDMTVRNLSHSTQQSYIYAVAEFGRHIKCPPDRLGMDVRD